MERLSAYLLLPLMLINLTVAENKWMILGLRPDQFLYAGTIVLAWYAGYASRYRAQATALALLAVALRLAAIVSGAEQLHDASFLALAFLFIIAGASLYGSRPLLLHRQLTVYLALCLPIMLLQTLGVSSLLMGWNIGYLHDPTLMGPEDIGTFKDVPVYPTFLVGPDDVVYSTGQGRPVGLMYAANPLSIVISWAVALNLTRPRTADLAVSDVVITAALVMAMSKLSLGIAVVLYLFFAASKAAGKRMLAMKLSGLMIFFLLLYYAAFPGLFATSLSEGMFMTAAMLRIVDLVKALGLEEHFPDLMQLGLEYRPSRIYEIGEDYSSIAALLRSKVLIPALVVGGLLGLSYLRAVRKMRPGSALPYVTMLCACALTQLAVPFVGAASFQLVSGFALFPILSGGRKTEAGLPRRKPAKAAPCVKT